MVLVISTFLLTKKHVCKNECKYECKNPKENDLCKKYIYIFEIVLQVVVKMVNI